MKILLRDVIESDLQIFFEQQLDPDAIRMAAFPSRDRKSFMAHWEKIMTDKSVFMQTIVFDGQVAGNVLKFEQSGRHKVGYWLGRAFWGKGVATQALSEFLGNVRIRPLYAHAAKHNLASIGFSKSVDSRFMVKTSFFSAQVAMMSTKLF